DLSLILRGWLNYFDLKGCSYTRVARRDLREYLNWEVTRYYRRKSQRKSSLYRQQAYDILVNKYQMIDVLKYEPSARF
ncbi:MAG: hypothetical protein LBC98_08070, partial [Prevotellaceae bacterium]|nr:hypothetical protein [Prevotellaceae bacterium]